MITKNFEKFMSTVLEGGNFTPPGLIPIKNTQGVDKYLSFRTAGFPATTNVNVVFNTSAGIHLGTGNTPSTENDYQLESQITSGLSASSTTNTYGLDTNGNPYVKYLFTVSNTTNSDIVISEIGYAQNFYASSSIGGSASAYTFLIDRTVLDTPVTVPANDSAALKYTLKTDLSAPTPVGPTIAEEKQVNFIDYDGTIVASYTATEINAMSSESDLPANPTHTGLTSQGWNWTLAQIKAQLTAAPNGKIWVGQMYVTTSGDTEIDIVLQDGRLSPRLVITLQGEVTIDWGDGSLPDDITDQAEKLDVQHNYALAGEYTIKVHCVSGAYTFKGDSSYTLLKKNVKNPGNYDNMVYSNCVRAIRLGTGTTGQAPSGLFVVYDAAFRDCTSLEYITIPSTIAGIGPSAFANCYSLKSVTVPLGVTQLPNYTFEWCQSLIRLSIPKSITSFGNQVFDECRSLGSITLPSYMTSIGTYIFRNCFSLSSIVLPNGITSIPNYAFESCYSLSHIELPGSVTSIGASAFNGCYALSTLTIPANVTSILAYAFNSCAGMAEYHLEPTTPPTYVYNSFNNIPDDCDIYVPNASLSSYQSSWSTYSSRLIGE